MLAEQATMRSKDNHNKNDDNWPNVKQPHQARSGNSINIDKENEGCCMREGSYDLGIPGVNIHIKW